MRVPIELVTGSDVERFTKAVQTVDCDVRLVGKDENGNDWELSAKSLFCSLILAAQAQHREHQFVSTLKRFCNKEYGENIWQARFYDHIIRNRRDYEEHVKYILENPIRWEYDELYSKE